MQTIERCLSTVDHFAIRFEAFCVSRVAQTLPASGGGGVNPPNAWFSAPAVGSKLILLQNLDL